MPPFAQELADAADAHFLPKLVSLQRMIGRGQFEVRGAGSVVHLSDGRTVIDFGSYAVSLLGHANPAVVEAACAEIHELPISTRLLANRAAATLASKLVGLLGVERLQ